MASEPTLSQTVFTRHTDDRLPYPVAACHLCMAVMEATPVPCQKCYSVWYCTEAHRDAYSARHERKCERYEQKLKRKTVSFEEIPSDKRRAYILRDWFELHYYTIAKFLLFAMRTYHETANVRQYQATFRLKYRPDCDQNPSVAFEVESCKIEQKEKQADPVLDHIVKRFDEQQEMDKLRKFKKYSTAIPCVFKVDNDEFRFISASYVRVTQRMQEFIGAADIDRLDYNWFPVMKYLLEEGYVFRRIPANSWFYSHYWKVGQLEPRGNDWVWQPMEKTGHMVWNCKVHLLSDWDDEDSGSPTAESWVDYTEEMETEEMESDPYPLP